MKKFRDINVQIGTGVVLGVLMGVVVVQAFSLDQQHLSPFGQTAVAIGCADNADCSGGVCEAGSCRCVNEGSNYSTNTGCPDDCAIIADAYPYCPGGHLTLAECQTANAANTGCTSSSWGYNFCGEACTLAPPGITFTNSFGDESTCISTMNAVCPSMCNISTCNAGSPCSGTCNYVPATTGGTAASCGCISTSSSSSSTSCGPTSDACGPGCSPGYVCSKPPGAAICSCNLASSSSSSSCLATGSTYCYTGTESPTCCNGAPTVDINTSTGVCSVNSSSGILRGCTASSSSSVRCCVGPGICGGAPSSSSSVSNSNSSSSDRYGYISCIGACASSSGGAYSTMVDCLNAKVLACPGTCAGLGANCGYIPGASINPVGCCGAPGGSLVCNPATNICDSTTCLVSGLTYTTTDANENRCCSGLVNSSAPGTSPIVFTCIE